MDYHREYDHYDRLAIFLSEVGFIYDHTNTYVHRHSSRRSEGTSRSTSPKVVYIDPSTYSGSDRSRGRYVLPPLSCACFLNTLIIGATATLLRTNLQDDMSASQVWFMWILTLLTPLGSCLDFEHVALDAETSVPAVTAPRPFHLENLLEAQGTEMRELFRGRYITMPSFFTMLHTSYFAMSRSFHVCTMPMFTDRSQSPVHSFSCRLLQQCISANHDLNVYHHVPFPFRAHADYWYLPL